jgi:carbamoyltransferase
MKRISSQAAYAILRGASKVKPFLKKRCNKGWQLFDSHITIPKDLRTKYILGVNAHFHDSSAALLVDGKLVAATEEERFSRKKHDSSFPENAIRFCLDYARIQPRDIDAVAYFEDPDEKMPRILDMLLTYPPSKEHFENIFSQWKELKCKEGVRRSLLQLGINGEVVFLKHHLSHAASSYLMSGFDDAAILTVDGVGEKTTTAIGYGRGSDIQLLKCINFPHSLGLLYTALTTYLGFRANNDEYKVMGLASYGNPDLFLSQMRRLVQLEPDGSFSINPDFFCFGDLHRMYTDTLEQLVGFPPRNKESEIKEEHKNLAATLQRITEEVVFNILNNLYELTRSKNLCIAGGTALNSVLNGKILTNTPFERIFIQPAAGDGGTAIGAAKYLYHRLNPDKPKEKWTHSYYGPEVSEAEIRKFLDKNNIKYTEFKSDKELLETTARLVYENKVVGWFQGRMEWGPRALGNRSILANPCNPDMKDILNEKVKHREMFRPFAPVVCTEDAEKFFEIDKPLPVPADFMLMVYPVKEEKREKLPSITHVDGSGRLQSIRREQNPLYHDLIKEFGKLSGEPVLINTSFNIRGEPIVCTPKDAYNCMMGTEIDYLVIGRFLVKRSDNL